jgi:hypothetical protein
LTAAVDGLADPDVHQILPSVKHKGVVIAACGEGAYRSEDRGDHWEKPPLREIAPSAPLSVFPFA